MEHGDLDLDFMMAKGSNLGIYLQGRYEIQLFDSLGKKTAKYSVEFMSVGMTQNPKARKVIKVLHHA
ncbi:MAG: hypothetical protein ACK4YV_10330 [Emticicia sp.]